MNFLLILTLSYALVLLPCVTARFNLPTCWGKDCVNQNNQGTWCYLPAAGETSATSCSNNGPDFTLVMDVHLRQGLSIAYYRGTDNTLLGGSNWPVPDNPGIVRLCLSGQAGDGSFQSLCTNAVADNVLQNSPYCEVNVPQHNVSDGCYNPTVLISTPTNNPSFGTSFPSAANTSLRSLNKSLLEFLSLIGLAIQGFRLL